MPNPTRSQQVTTAPATPAVIGDVIKNAGAVAGISVFCEMVGGAGGTSITMFVQTSLDGGVTWFDIMAFPFTTSVPRQLGLISRNDQAIASGVTLSLFSLPPGTNGAAINAPLGDQFRFAYSSVGTFSGTKLNVAYSLTY